MLKNWTSHADYRHFVSSAVTYLNSSQRKRLSSMQFSLDKLTALNLDVLKGILKPHYSSTGRPALNQPEIFRSFILMMDMRETSLTNWVDRLKSDDILSLMIGCTPYQLPSLGSYYDFINRLWLADNDNSSLEKLHPYPLNSKPKSSPGKNKKLLNPHAGIVSKLVNFFKDGRSFSGRFEYLLQNIFAQLAVVPSLKLNLIDSTCLTLSGDGTAVHIHASSRGTKTCDCNQHGIYRCTCERKYSAPDASIGWDSYLGRWFYGYTLYALSAYNPKLKIDLPMYLRFVEAKRHDSITSVVAVAEFQELLPKVPIKNICFDSASDNYATYEMCQHFKINPFIDLNLKRGAKAKYHDTITISSKNGIPFCMAGHPMLYWGYCRDRSRHKWRCPIKAKACDLKCNCQKNCSPSDYGRVFYTKSSDDIRLYTPVPRGTKGFKDIYKTRTCAERINNRILNDYRLHTMRIRSKKRFSFFTMIAGINIHLDARIKQANLIA